MPDIRAEILSLASAAWRRRWLALGLCWALCTAGWVAVYLLPNRYQAEARIYLDTDTLLGPLLRNLAVENDLQRRVQIMQHTLLSRPNLHQVMVATDMILDVKNDADEQEVTNRLEKNTHITAQGPNLFSITYTDANAVRARDVVQALITVLVESNTGQNRKEMEKARSFIEKQIAAYEQQLRATEARMADFKAKHVDELASNNADFTGRLDTARRAKDNARTALAESRGKLTQLDAQLRGIPQFLDIESAPQVVFTGQRDPLQMRIAQAESDLAALKLRYTDKHPDVMAAQKALDELKAQVAAQDKSGTRTYAGRSKMPNPIYEQIMLRRLDAEQAVELDQARLSQAEAEEKRLIGLAGSAPKVEAQYADLSREYSVQKKDFEELLARRESARISEAVENTSNKIDFRVVEPPVVPIKPAGPNRPLFAAMVLIGSIGMSLGTVVLLHRIQQPVSSEQELVERFDLPVIGVVSLLPSPKRREIKRRSTRRFVLAALSLLIAFAGVLALSSSKIPLKSPFSLTGQLERTSKHAA